MITWRNSICRV